MIDLSVKYTLHNYRRCPFCIRVRIMMYLKGIDYDIIEEPLRMWTSWMKEWSVRTGERPRVPVLRCAREDGSEIILTESNAINLTLDTRHGEVSYTPAEASREYQDMLDWFSWCDDVFKPQVDIYKYGKNLHFDPIAGCSRRWPRCFACSPPAPCRPTASPDRASWRCRCRRSANIAANR